MSTRRVHYFYATCRCAISWEVSVLNQCTSDKKMLIFSYVSLISSSLFSMENELIDFQYLMHGHQILLREISWLSHPSKDRRTRRKCEYGMYARLAMYTRAHQNLSKRDGYIGHVHGRTKRGIDRRQKAVVMYSA